MKNKAIAIALIALMGISAVGMMPANVKGAAENINGYLIDSMDGTLTYYDGTSYYGIILAHTSEDPTDWSNSTNNGGDANQGGFVSYTWDTTTGDPFDSQPVTGDHMYIYGEALKDGMGAADGTTPANHLGNNVANYTFASNWTIAEGVGASPANLLDNVAVWEPINVSATGDPPQTIRSGADWMNITVQAFRFTSYQYVSPNWNKATFDNCVGFVAHIKYKGGGWLGNYTISNFTAGPNAPANAAPGVTDPGSTGYWWINLTSPTVSSAPGGDTVKLANNYIVQVSALFTDGAGGTYETTGWSEPPITVPEFSTILIPILATIGLFVAVSYVYRRKN